MRAEVIAIGDELTGGQRLDTNSQWLSQQFALLGVPVTHHTTVGDDHDAIVDVLATACRRSALVLVSGGLGPTADDLTRQAIAALTGRPLVQDDQSLEYIRGLFARRGRPMPEQNIIQACFPEGSRPIANVEGTAPGIHVTLDGPGGTPVDLFALPGVPAELKPMWQATVAPAIAARLGAARRVIQQREIRCFGAGESDIESRLPDLIRRGRDPLVGITASEATITLRVTAEGATCAECEAKIAPTVATIYNCLGSLVFGENDTQLQDAVCDLLADRGAVVATAEWGTAGLVSSWLGGARRAATAFRGGLIVQDLPALTRWLGFDVNTKPPSPPDPPRYVAQMARAVRERFNTDYGLAVGPCPDSESAGQVHLAVAARGDTIGESFTFAAHPAIQRHRCAKQALNLLRLSILERRI